MYDWVHTKEGKEAFKVADSQGTDYFFASASLFMTMLAVELLKSSEISPFFWVTEDGESVVQLFQCLFEEVWHQFVEFWNDVADKSMMQFNTNLNPFS